MTRKKVIFFIVTQKNMFNTDVLSIKINIFFSSQIFIISDGGQIIKCHQGNFSFCLKVESEKIKLIKNFLIFQRNSFECIVANPIK